MATIGTNCREVSTPPVLDLYMWRDEGACRRIQAVTKTSCLRRNTNKKKKKTTKTISKQTKQKCHWRRIFWRASEEKIELIEEKRTTNWLMYSLWVVGKVVAQLNFGIVFKMGCCVGCNENIELISEKCCFPMLSSWSRNWLKKETIQFVRLLRFGMHQ